MKEYIGGWMPIGPYGVDKSDPFGWRPPMNDERNECDVHSWSSTNFGKECPFCVAERQREWPFE